MKKKIYILIIALFTFIIGVNNVKAVTGTIKSGTNLAWKRYQYSSAWVVSKTPLLTVDDQKSFCVELNKSLNLTNNVGTNATGTALQTFLNNNTFITKTVTINKKSMSQYNYLTLVSYYGDKLGGVNNYLAAQKLVWDQVTKPQITFVEKTFFENYSNRVLTNAIDLTTETTNIKNNILNYYKIPSFCGDTITLDSTKTITDTNEVLNNYTASNCTINGNDLNCNAITSDTTITLARKRLGTGSSYVYSKNGGQGVLKYGQTPTISCTVTVKVPTATSTPGSAKIRIVKKSEIGELLEGITFKACNQETNVCEEGTTGSNGIATINITLESSEATPTYVITEKNIPIQFKEVTPASQNVTIQDGKIYSMLFTNKYKKGNVKVKKIDSNNNPIKDVKFDIYRVAATEDDADELVEEITTDANGDAVSTANNLIYGDYYLKEAAVPEGYIIDSKTKHPFKIETDGTTVEVATITNELQSTQIKIIKTSKDDEKPMKGVVFEVYSVTQIIDEANGSEELTLVDTITTDDKGEATTKKLLYGKYRIIETKTLDGYILDDTPHDVTLDKNETYELSLINDKNPPTGDVRILLIITLGLCSLAIAIIAYIKKNQIAKNNAI